jgi:hypothetical protein
MPLIRQPVVTVWVQVPPWQESLVQSRPSAEQAVPFGCTRWSQTPDRQTSMVHSFPSSGQVESSAAWDQTVGDAWSHASQGFAGFMAPWSWQVPSMKQPTPLAVALHPRAASHWLAVHDSPSSGHV